MASLSLNASVSHVGKIDIRSTTFKGVVMNLTHMKMYGNKYIVQGLNVFYFITIYVLYLFPYISDVVDLDVEFDKIHNKMRCRCMETNTSIDEYRCSLLKVLTSSSSENIRAFAVYGF